MWGEGRRSWEQGEGGEEEEREEEGRHARVVAIQVTARAQRQRQGGLGFAHARADKARWFFFPRFNGAKLLVSFFLRFPFSGLVTSSAWLDAVRAAGRATATV